MAFSAKLVKRTSTGSGRMLIYEFTQAATVDTGGDIDVDIGQVQAVLVSQTTGTAGACKATFANQTVTVTVPAGVTGGYVMVIGIG